MFGSGKIAVDFGSTNTVVAVAGPEGVRILHLPGLGREQPSAHSALIPTAVHYPASPRPNAWLPWQRIRPQIGQQALHRNFDGCSPGFAQGLKRALADRPHQQATRCGETPISAHRATEDFLREILKSIRRHDRIWRIADLTIPTPVGFYETYRAELQQIGRRLGIRHLRSLDEPVAAALGYGVRLEREKTLVVVDFGGGTLDLAAVRLSPQTTETGAAPVLAKHMAAVGGDDVDTWLAEYLGLDLTDLPLWHNDARWEMMRLKEHVSRHGHGELSWRGIRRSLCVEELEQLLAKRGLYDCLRLACQDIQKQLDGVQIDEVVLVGGSTLLPGIAAEIDQAFPSSVVRHDPETLFTAVAVGAALFAGGVPLDDFVYHDYCLAVQNPETQSVEYELLVPQRTRYPVQDMAVRYYADYHGMHEIQFKICEAGRLGQVSVPWQARPNGAQYWAPQNASELARVLPINAADEPIRLRPRGQGTSPRLRVTYSINADRWLCTSVDDLVADQRLRTNAPVARLR
jgi:molecular chaperone DnaK (HSP70)